MCVCDNTVYSICFHAASNIGTHIYHDKNLGMREMCVYPLLQS